MHHLKCYLSMDTKINTQANQSRSKTCLLSRKNNLGLSISDSEFITSVYGILSNVL